MFQDYTALAVAGGAFGAAAVVAYYACRALCRVVHAAPALAGLMCVVGCLGLSHTAPVEPKKPEFSSRYPEHVAKAELAVHESQVGLYKARLDHFRANQVVSSDVSVGAGVPLLVLGVLWLSRWLITAK